MAKTLIDVDETYLAAAQEALQTKTEKDTVNEALRAVVAMEARRRDLARMVSGELPDLADEQVMRAATPDLSHDKPGSPVIADLVVREARGVNDNVGLSQ